jgi:type IV pilus assembly protein PilO
MRARAVAARLALAEREVRQLEASLRATEAVIPEEKDPQDVLRSLHELASESLIEIASFKDKPIVAKAQYTEWPIELGLEGSYHDLGRFFDRIASTPRLISVSDLQIKTKTRPNGRGTVTASCVATTFVFQKEMAPAAAGGQP